ncbi:uncharacterized protein LOC142768598 [Rhipicephalus microplus]|uniref:uncharacterized protein LOC142768598 n=1 Tax=Rhipicephalus microplus TaxID=6941 RepID=UPI003F6C53A6
MWTRALTHHHQALRRTASFLEHSLLEDHTYAHVSNHSSRHSIALLLQGTYSRGNCRCLWTRRHKDSQYVHCCNTRLLLPRQIERGLYDHRNYFTNNVTSS